MEHIQLPLLPWTKGPGLTAVQEYAQDTGFIDLDPGICRQLLIKSYSLCESREHVAALPMRLSSSTYRKRVSEIVEPRYTNS